MRFVDKFIVVVLVALAAVLTFGAFYFKPPSPLLIEQARVPGADGGSFVCYKAVRVGVREQLLNCEKVWE